MSYLSGWGRFPRIATHIVTPRQRHEVAGLVAAHDSLIAHGYGRSYGDCALNARTTLRTTGLDRLLAFDPTSGLLTCEAGVLLADIVDLFVPRGWFPAVTPGTRFVSIGGMIAADVHGKNHHIAGTFGDCVEGFDLLLADGRLVHCSRTENADLFAATIGGMGLTGLILSASFRLIPIETSQIRQETLKAENLDEVMARFEDSRTWTYSVAWIDCLASGSQLGRSLLFRGEHALVETLPHERRNRPLETPRKRRITVPFDFPSFALNRWSVRAFNEVYYRAGRPGHRLVGYETFFYPLDAILEWNRIYGRSGFTQYQCVLPKAASREGLNALLGRISASGKGSFLAVLKLFGAQSGVMSFPMEGYTLALDFSADAANLALLSELDAIVADCGGRLYLAKDARTTPEMIRQGYPNMATFKAIRDRVDPERKFSSLQSQRLDL
jgi:FAD/FMN-containing dehydrogenase